jgi:hypothetical protein
MNVCGEVEVWFHVFLSLALDEVVVILRPQMLYPLGMSTLIPIE